MLDIKIIPEMKNSLNELNSRLNTAEEMNYYLKTENYTKKLYKRKHEGEK